MLKRTAFSNQTRTRRHYIIILQFILYASIVTVKSCTVSYDLCFYIWLVDYVFLLIK